MNELNAKSIMNIMFIGYRVTFFLPFPLLIVTGYADTGKTGMVLHLRVFAFRGVRSQTDGQLFTGPPRFYFKYTTGLIPILDQCCSGEKRTGHSFIKEVKLVFFFCSHTFNSAVLLGGNAS